VRKRKDRDNGTMIQRKIVCGQQRSEGVRQRNEINGSCTQNPYRRGGGGVEERDGIL
jgi:hypothetical protein